MRYARAPASASGRNRAVPFQRSTAKELTAKIVHSMRKEVRCVPCGKRQKEAAETMLRQAGRRGRAVRALYVLPRCHAAHLDFLRRGRAEVALQGGRLVRLARE